MFFAYANARMTFRVKSVDLSKIVAFGTCFARISFVGPGIKKGATILQVHGRIHYGPFSKSKLRVDDDGGQKEDGHWLDFRFFMLL